MNNVGNIRLVTAIVLCMAASSTTSLFGGPDEYMSNLKEQADMYGHSQEIISNPSTPDQRRTRLLATSNMGLKVAIEELADNEELQAAIRDEYKAPPIAITKFYGQDALWKWSDLALPGADPRKRSERTMASIEFFAAVINQAWKR